uniref:Collagen n=1 Tax=Heterorhabditis bacteriophora TaxID=37862 RepID=A0A1I7XHP0_HETBA
MKQETIWKNSVTPEFGHLSDDEQESDIVEISMDCAVPPVCPHGPQGPPGQPGIKGEDGLDGVNGDMQYIFIILLALHTYCAFQSYKLSRTSWSKRRNRRPRNKWSTWFTWKCWISRNSRESSLVIQDRMEFKITAFVLTTNIAQHPPADKYLYFSYVSAPAVYETIPTGGSLDVSGEDSTISIPYGTPFTSKLFVDSSTHRDQTQTIYETSTSTESTMNSSQELSSTHLNYEKPLNNSETDLTKAPTKLIETGYPSANNE